MKGIQLLAFSPVDGHAFIQIMGEKPALRFLKPPYNQYRIIDCTYPEMKYIISQNAFYEPVKPKFFTTEKAVITFLEKKTALIWKEMGIKTTKADENDVIEFLNNLPIELLKKEVSVTIKKIKQHGYLGHAVRYLKDLYKTKQVKANIKLKSKIEKNLTA